MRALLAACLALALFAGPAAAEGTLDKLRTSGSLKLGYRIDAPPFSYRNNVGEAAGYSVALCRAVASALKDTLPLASLTIEYVAVTAENRFASVQDGSVDLLCGATTATLSRRKLVDFSIPTFIDGAGVLLLQNGPRSFTELEGRKVGVRSGTTTETALRNTVRELGITIETVPVDDHREGLARLLDGEIAGYFADRAILFYNTLALPEADAQRLFLSDRQFTYEPYALAMRRGDTEFRLAVDTALSRMYRTGVIADIFSAAFGSRARPSKDLQALYRIAPLPE